MTTPAQPPARGKADGSKFPSLKSPMTWALILGIAVAGGAYILYRRNKNAAAATTVTPAPDTTDLQGQIATLQTEVADLQSSAAQDEAGETGTGTTRPGGGSGPPPGGHPVPRGPKLTAPAGFSVTPHAGYADFGWGKVDGAHAYELQVAGAGGHGTGTSHYDHAGTGNHAEHVRLANGNYHARVRAGTSTASLTGPWTPWKPFHVGRAIATRAASNGSGGGESENDTGSG